MGNNEAYFRRVTKQIKKKAIENYANQAEKIAKLWREFMREQMEFSKKSGRLYTKAIGGIEYTWVASAPGEYPAVVTGRLLNSMRTAVTRENDTIRISMWFEAEYAQELELDPNSGQTGKGRRPLIWYSRLALLDLAREILQVK